jgi:hypothetical protein
VFGVAASVVAAVAPTPDVVVDPLAAAVVVGLLDLLLLPHAAATNAKLTKPTPSSVHRDVPTGFPHLRIGLPRITPYADKPAPEALQTERGMT